MPRPLRLRRTAAIKKLTLLAIVGGMLTVSFVVCCGVASTLSGKGKRQDEQASAPAKQTSRPEKQRSTPAAAVPDFTLTAEELFAEYERNGVAADDKYKGKILRVSGTVDRIDTELLGRPYATFRIGEIQVFTVQAVLKDRADAAKLFPGQAITVQGRCSGKALNVVMNDCTLAN